MSSWISSLPFRSGTGSSLDNAASLPLPQQRDKNIFHHAVKYQELELKQKRIGLLSKSQTKKWFVLYEHSYHTVSHKKWMERNVLPLMNDAVFEESLRKVSVAKAAHPDDEEDALDLDDHNNQHTNDNEHDDDDDFELSPARLEYYDSEKQWREGYQPARTVILRSCFDINKRNESGNQFVITVYTMEDEVEIVFYHEQEMRIWLDLLLTCKEGGRSIQGRIALPNFESVWSVDVVSFTAIESASTNFSMSGPHRLCFKDRCLLFFQVGSNDNPKHFPIKSIRKSGTDKKYFILITGSSTISGVGELKILCKDKEMAENLDEEFQSYVKKMRQSQNIEPRRQRRQSRPPRNCEASHFSGCRDPSLYSPAVALNNSTVGLSLRSRSYSDCNKKAAPPTQVAASTAHICPHSLGAIPRTRTVSEGNSHIDVHTRSSRNYAHRSVASGSPLSPGSFISSESAGSSNSVDSDTVTTGFDSNRFASSLMATLDTNATTTIIEESSAESCIDPTSFKKNVDQPLSEGYMHVDVVSASIDIPSNVKNTLSYAASPPGGGGVQYSSILDSHGISKSAVAADSPSDYVIMTRQPSSSIQSSSPFGSGSHSSSKKQPSVVETKRKKLNLLGLEDHYQQASRQTISTNRNISRVYSASSKRKSNSVTSPSSHSASMEEDSYLMMSPIGNCCSVCKSTLPKEDLNGKGNPSYNQRWDIDNRDGYIPMSPIRQASSLNRKTAGWMATNAGTSPSYALTSHFTDRLPLYEPGLNYKHCEEDTSEYVVMNPLNVDLSKKNADQSESESSNVATSSALLPLGQERSAHNSSKRSSHHSDEELIQGAQQLDLEEGDESKEKADGAQLVEDKDDVGAEEELEDEDPLENYVDFMPPALLQNHQRKSNIIPISNSNLISREERGSPAGSLLSGTPNSTSRITGSDNDDDFDFKVSSAASKSRKISNSSPSSRFIDIPGQNKSHSSVSPNNVSGQSPSSSSISVASWLGSLFIRSRSGSVPCKPAFMARRRHRTQSEGENDKADSTTMSSK